MNIISRQDKSTQALIYANLLPMFGVLFLSWSVLEILYTYWLETSIIGVVTVMKMSKAKIMSTKQLTGKEMLVRIALIIFFILHYGGFLSGYFVFIFGVFPALLGAIDNSILSNLSILGIVISAVGLFFSHFMSYKQNFIGKNEFKNTNILLAMFAPYKRIVVLHMTIILGAFLSLLIIVTTSKILSTLNYDNVKLIFTVTQSAILLLFIWLKITIDKKYHLREHAELEKTLNNTAI